MKLIFLILRIVLAVVLLGIAKTFLVEGGYPYSRPGIARSWQLIVAGFAIGVAAWLLTRSVRGANFRMRR